MGFAGGDSSTALRVALTARATPVHGAAFLDTTPLFPHPVFSRYRPASLVAPPPLHPLSPLLHPPPTPPRPVIPSIIPSGGTLLPGPLRLHGPGWRADHGRGALHRVWRVRWPSCPHGGGGRPDAGPVRVGGPGGLRGVPELAPCPGGSGPAVEDQGRGRLGANQPQHPAAAKVCVGVCGRGRVCGVCVGTHNADAHAHAHAHANKRADTHAQEQVLARPPGVLLGGPMGRYSIFAGA
jgi:hypothetical protein